MKIATWNINSVRARVDRLVGWLKTASPDVLCLQELKCTDDQFPRAEVEAAGYRCCTFGQKTYNGVALLTKGPVTGEVRNIDDGEADEQARLLLATVDGVQVVSLYAPNGQEVGSEAHEYKLGWYRRLERWLQKRPPGPLVLAGDFNVAPEDLDVWDPRLFQGRTLFSEPERNALRSLTRSLGLVDAVRTLHPAEPMFSWWDYRMLGFPKNHGLRIDHLLVTADLAARLKAAGVDREARKGKQPSDHAPVWIELA
ncbi:MAG: exodeoxyribonuclease III [Myxococcaceae bacterium]|nr:exodeoxyribonuclease III [Myxococcaceae bacterium]